MLDDRNIVQLTVDEMQRIVRTYANDVAMYAGQSVVDFYGEVQRVPYVSDLDQCGYLECIQRPAATIARGGDCDDKSIMAGAYFHLNKIPWRFVVIATRPDGLPRHVFVEFQDGITGRWVAFDATTTADRFGFSRRYYKRWEYPMQYNRIAENVVTFEDGVSAAELQQWGQVGKQLADLKGVKFQDVTASALPGLAAGLLGPVGVVLGTVWSFLASIIPIRTATKQMTYDEAEAKAIEITNGIMKQFYYPMPASGKAEFARLVSNFYTAYFSKFSTWWDGALKKADESHRALLVNEEARVWFYLHDAMFNFLRHEDITRVQETFNRDVYQNILDPMVLRPMTEYVTGKLLDVKNSDKPVTDPGTGTQPKPATAGFSMGTGGILALAGIAGALLFMKNKKR